MNTIAANVTSTAPTGLALLAGALGAEAARAVGRAQVLVGDEFVAEGLTHTAQAGQDVFDLTDLVIDLLDETVDDFFNGDRLYGAAASAAPHGSRHAGRVALVGAGGDGQAQRLAAEQDHRRGPGMPAHRGVQAHQHIDGRPALALEAADFGQGVAHGTPTPGHFVFGQAQLGDSVLHEVDQSVNAIGRNCHVSDITARKVRASQLISPNPVLLHLTVRTAA